jgi:uncharacterized membrane protein
MTFEEAMNHVAQGFEVVGALVLLVGLLVSLGLGARAYSRTRDGSLAYRALRESFGGVILLGLEVLVAADLIRTVAVEATLESVAVLGAIVAIRTVLSFSLETEIEGVVPWRRAAMSGAGRVRSAARRAPVRRSPPPRSANGGEGGASPRSR